MDLRLDSASLAATAAPRASAALARPSLLNASAPREAGFSDLLSGALHSVSAAQNHATGLQREVQLDNPQVSLEQTMVALQKAQIGFQATLHVRNRMVQAYTDIMNMQV